MILAGAPNFRDLGGAATTGGGTVRCGLVFRSQVLSDATDADLEVIRLLKIGAVLDLRDPEDRGRVNRWPAELAPQAISVDAARTTHGIRAAQLRRRLQDPGFDEASARSVVLGLYREMPNAYAPHLGALLRWLAEPARPPVLVHCEAGKDRTGFVCAVLLLTLGVPLEAVIADYLLSRDGYPVAALRAVVGDDLPPTTSKALQVLADVDAASLTAALREIEAQHGSIDVYLREGAGVTDDELRAVRANLLER